MSQERGEHLLARHFALVAEIAKHKAEIRRLQADLNGVAADIEREGWASLARRTWVRPARENPPHPACIERD